MATSPYQAPPRNRKRAKKLLYHLRRMSETEHAEFALWLRSPLHSNSPQFADFLDILLEEMVSGAESVPANRLHAAIPSHQNNPPADAHEAHARDKYLGVRLSKMMHELRSFLTWKQLASSPHASPPLLLQAMCDHNCDKYIDGYTSFPKGKQDSDLASQLRAQLEMETSLVDYAAAKGSKSQPPGAAHAILDDLFLLEKVKYACAGQLTGLPESDPESSYLLAAALKEMENREQAGNLPAVATAYLFAFRMLENNQQSSSEGESYYKRFRQIFRDNQSWARQDAMDLFVHGHNYCILQFQQGRARFIEDVKQLYDEILAAGQALQGGILPYQFYKNVVEVMCKLKNYDWAEEFTERFRGKLAVEHAPQMYAYNQAIVNFFRQDYSAVVSGLSQQMGKLASLQTGIGARVYLCRALWKTNEQTWLIQQLQAFEQHLRRNRELQDTERRRYQGFVRYMSRASQAITGSPAKTRESLKELLDTIEEKEPPMLYQWLRQELKEKLKH